MLYQLWSITILLKMADIYNYFENLSNDFNRRKWHFNNLDENE